MPLTSKVTTGIIFFTGIAIILIYSIFSGDSPLTSIGMLAFLCLIAVFLQNPKWGIFIILFLRPSTDFLSDHFTLRLSDNFALGIAPLFGLLIIGLTSIYLFRKHVRLFSVPLFFPWFFFIAAAGLSILYSVDPLASVYETVRIISIFSLFALIYALFHDKKNAYQEMIKLILISSIIPLSMALYQLLTGTGLGGTTGIESRIFGTFAHPNAFASFLLILFVMSVYLAWKDSNTFNQKCLYWIMSAGSGLLLLATFSRGAWLALIIFILLFGIFRSPRIIFAGIAIITLLFFTSQTVHDRIEDVYNPPADSSILWRFQKWQKVYTVFKAAPVFGTGAGTELVVHENEHGFYAGNPYTHNDLLKIALENGIVGLAFYLLIISVTIIKLILLYKKNSSSQEKLFIFCVLLLFIAQIGFSMSSNIWRGTASMWFVWALVATALSLQTKTAPRKLF